MRQRPKFSYRGLTVVLSQPSRMDLKEGKLLSGYAGVFFNQECLYPEMNILQCDVRTSDTLMEPLLEGTKAILLLGLKAMHEWAQDCDEYTVGEKRGTPLQNHWNLPMIASWLPQDCMDVVDHESRLNPELKDYEETKEDDEEESTGKHKGGTARENYRFWLYKDTKKIIGSINERYTSSSLRTNESPRIYPSSNEIVERLTQTKNDQLYLDLETDSLFQINCIGFTFAGDSPIYVVPICRYNYTPAYGNLGEILSAFAVGFRDNCVVCHNSLFDLLILAWKYKIPIGKRNYDTMLAWHKCYPEAEKSLGHVMSCLTWEPYHKDEGAFQPQSASAEQKLWEYNAKDVYGTKLIREAIDAYAATQPGLAASINQSNECIRPYLINTLTGIRYSQERLESMMRENDRKCMAYTELIKYGLGEELYNRIKGKSPSSLAASPDQAVKYFHDTMDYKVVGKTKGGNPSLAADYLYRLKLKYPQNIIIDLVLAYRERAKESGSLKFNPWCEPLKL